MQVVNLRIKPLMLLARHLAGLHLIAFYLADVHYQTVHQLHIRHFQREHRHGNAVVHRHVLRHRKHKRRLTHSRTRSNNHQVRFLPAGSNLVQVRKAGRNTRQVTLVLACNIYASQCLCNHIVHLHHVALLRPLANLEDTRFGLLHQFFHILCLVVAGFFYACCHGYQVARCGFLRHYLRVVAQVGGRCHQSGKFAQGGRAAYFLKCALLPQFLRHGHHVYRLLFGG